MKERTMKPIHVIEMIDKPFLGGGQRHLLSLAESLKNSDFEVSVCSSAEGPLEEACRQQRIPFIPARFGGKYDFRIFGDLVKILHRNPCHILHTHGGIAGIYGRAAAVKAKVPVVVHTIHGIHYLHYRNPMLKYLSIIQEKFFSRSTDAVIFVSDRDKELGIKYGLAPKSRSHVIKNGIDFAAVDQIGKDIGLKAAKLGELDISPGTPVLGTIARLHRQKGLCFLLDAMPEILKIHPKVVLIIAGGGPDETVLKNQVHNLNIGNSVLLLGERTDALVLLSLFDIFVLPSLWEGLPYVLLEAAAMAKPVAATRVDGIDEVIIDGRTGFLVPPCDSRALAASINRLFSDNSLAKKLGDQLKDAASKTFTQEEMMRRIKKLYISLVKDKLES